MTCRRACKPVKPETSSAEPEIILPDEKLWYDPLRSPYMTFFWLRLFGIIPPDDDNS